jgi:hypothetical protein
MVIQYCGRPTKVVSSCRRLATEQTTHAVVCKYIATVGLQGVELNDCAENKNATR